MGLGRVVIVIVVILKQARLKCFLKGLKMKFSIMLRSGIGKMTIETKNIVYVMGEMKDTMWAVG